MIENEVEYTGRYTSSNYESYFWEKYIRTNL